MPGSCNPKLARPAALGYAPGMDTPETAIALPLHPLHPKELERQLLTGAGLDSQAQDAILEHLKYLTVGYITQALLRDARMQAKSAPARPSATEREAYVHARRQLIDDYYRLHPARQEVMQGGSVIIDVPATCKPIRAAKAE
jgi:hypothetical protein